MQAAWCSTRSCGCRPCCPWPVAPGWHTVAVTASPLPGPSGNVEYFLWLRARTNRALTGDALQQAVQRAVAEGPQ